MGTSTRPEPLTPKNDVRSRAEFWLMCAALGVVAAVLQWLQPLVAP